MTVNTEYKVLARKYRPQTFGDLIGQETLVQILTNAITTSPSLNDISLTELYSWVCNKASLFL